MECIVCCEEMNYSAKYSCDHATCYKCATKLLYLYNDKKCPLCKKETNYPIYCEALEIKKEVADTIENNKLESIGVLFEAVESLNNLKISPRLAHSSDSLKMKTKSHPSINPPTNKIAHFNSKEIENLKYQLSE